MARAKTAAYDEQRARILNEAVEAFGRLGYPSASMASLAQACQVSKATLYHYFESKEALLFEALDAYTRRLLEQVESVRQEAAALPRAEGVRRLLHALTAEYRSSQAYHAALLHDVKFLGDAEREAIRSQERAVVHAVGDILSRAWPQAYAAAPSPSVLTMTLLGMVNFSFTWLRPGGPVGPEAFADLVLDLWERGMTGPMQGSD